jgi:pyruvate/2-oxoglutarate dehydrogenase complex dihydrolipoamide acyltransferase (E2) component
VVKIHVSSGDNVPIGATILTLETADAAAPATKPTEAAPASEAAPAAPPAEAPATAPSTPTADRKETAAEGPDEQPAAAAQPEPQPTPPAATAAKPPAQPATPPPASTQVSAPPASSGSGETAAAGPAIRRLAREVGIDLASITGSGPGGRILREDVLTAVRRSSAPTAASTMTSAHDTTTSSPNAATPSLPASSSHATTTESTSDDWGPIRVERMTKIRKTIAAKMHESWVTAPRVTNFDDADVTELERIRQASKADYATRGIKLTMMPFVVKAVGLALRQNPTINAAIDPQNEQIIYKQYVNVGIAVDTERGLVVPVLRKPDELTIPDIARSLSVIADNARNNNFKIEDLRGGTFSISNLGAIGGTYSTPIINVPEVAILLLGRSRKLPMVVNDQVAVRLMMPLSLSYDHRLVDGAAAARFLNDVINYLENPSRLLIAP